MSSRAFFPNAIAIPPGGRRRIFAPSWNAAPTDPLPVVRFDPEALERSLDVMRRGLIPNWPDWRKDIKIGFSTFNARAELHDRMPVVLDFLSLAGMARRAAGRYALSEVAPSPSSLR
jgi:putative SOS response-associated peptidase YedK